MLFALILLACASAPEAIPPVAAAPELSAAAQQLPVAQAVQTPAEQYAACRERVELPEQDGECAVDGDCTARGCGSERCVAAVSPEGLSTCEDRPCFKVLDACGCHQGRCTWTLREPAAPALALPPRTRE
ncbi:MAG: hypothetical protein JXX28_00950 [Deltaproteobacteria bacterium]|nr:hypothetical protein [Deltaproteobacteria bacterium]